MGTARERRDGLAGEIAGRLVRRHSTAAVLFHHAVAERLGLGPTDHKCLDLLRERGAMTGSELAASTGLTTGAITGVVDRLERAGYVGRGPHPHDGRKQVLRPVPGKMSDFQEVLGPIRADLAALLEDFDDRQLAAIAEFLTGTTELIHRHAALLRAQSLGAAGAPAAPGVGDGPPKPAARRRHPRGGKARTRR
jgi:DNA-binding MarR family transcriptional regulator